VGVVEMLTHRDTVGDKEGDAVSENVRLLVGEVEEVRQSVGDAEADDDREALADTEPHAVEVVDTLGDCEAVAQRVAVVVSVMERVPVPDTEGDTLSEIVALLEELADGHRETEGDTEAVMVGV